MTNIIKEKLESGPLFDCFINEFHFTPYMRDYDILFDMPAFAPGKNRSYIHSRWRYRFTHCVMAQVTTNVADANWRVSWTDEFTNFEAWTQAGKPEGFVWGSCWSEAYPGLTYVDDSNAAQEWSERLNQPMHEVTIETNVQTFRLIFHDVIIQQVATGNPDTDEMAPI